MHDSFLMHDCNTLEYRSHHTFEFFSCELVSFFYFVIEDASLQVFDTKIQWVFSFVHSFQFHQAWVVKWPHNCDLIFQGLFSSFFSVFDFFGKGLYCIVLFVGVLDHQINCCKVTLPDFLNRLEEFMEVSLVQFLAQLRAPELNGFWFGAMQFNAFLIFLKFDSYSSSLMPAFLIFECVLAKNRKDCFEVEFDFTLLTGGHLDLYKEIPVVRWWGYSPGGLPLIALARSPLVWMRKQRKAR